MKFTTCFLFQNPRHDDAPILNVQKSVAWGGNQVRVHSLKFFRAQVEIGFSVKEYGGNVVFNERSGLVCEIFAFRFIPCLLYFFYELININVLIEGEVESGRKPLR